jgi:hypothetical protein
MTVGFEFWHFGSQKGLLAPWLLHCERYVYSSFANV